jgi:hypothetical protein
MNTANPNYLTWIVGALNTVTDDEANLVNSPDDENGTRRIIRLLIKPDFEGLRPEAQQQLKDSLRYYLTTEEADFYDILDLQYEWPIEPPTNAKDFFLWIWDELFPNQDFTVDRVADWSVSHDRLGAISMRESR